MRVAVWGTHTAALHLVEAILSELGLECTPLHVSFSEARSILARCWRDLDFIVCISPLPLCVRLISGLHESKLTDPAVVQVDLTNRLVVCVTGEHLRGGARLAKLLSEHIGFRAVDSSRAFRLRVTTLDELCFRLRLVPSDAKLLSRYVRLQCEGAKIRITACKRLVDCIRLIPGTDRHYVFTVCDSMPSNQLVCEVDTERKLVLRARSLVLGIGLCSCAHVDDLMFTIRRALSLFGMPLQRVDYVCVPDIRLSHDAVGFLSTLGVKVVSLPIDVTVRERGLSVAELLALSASSNLTLLVRKVRGRHVTAALAEEII